MKRKIVAPCALLCAFLLVAQAIPWPALAQEFPPSSPAVSTGLSDDVTLGLQLAVTLEETVGIKDDPAWTERIDRIGYRVAAASDDSETPFSFDVLDLPEPNALALPGGFIFVTRGMMEVGLDDNEMASLLGHEIGHVRKEHFQRAARIGSLVSLVQTALLFGILAGVQEDYSPERVEVNDDPGVNQWSVGMTGKEALVQGVSLFGNVLQTLFANSYSRKLEFEADDTGQRLAARAGFDPAGGPGLLQKLHERSFETHHFGYWRTHPYFTERVARAQSLANILAASPEVPDPSALGERVALLFSHAAERMPGEKEALYLYEHALRAAARGVASLDAELDLTRFRRRREEHKNELVRCYQCVIAAYDSLISRAEAIQPGWAPLADVREERNEVESSRQRLLDDYLAIINRDNAATSLLERFVENYADSPEAPQATLRLAAHYRLADRPAKAVEVLERLLKNEAAQTRENAAVRDSALATLEGAIGELEDMTVTYRMIDEWNTADPEAEQIARSARQRMDMLVAKDVKLETAGEFVRRYPDSPWAAQLRDRLAADANETYLKGRVHEGLQSYQEALDAYFAVLAWAPDAPAAEEAQAGIDRINKREGFEGE